MMPAPGWTITNMHELVTFAIYDHPRDHPNSFVVRRWAVRGGQSVPGEMRLAGTLAEARGLLPPGLHNLGRYPSDDPCIVEVWI
jgi:hypothetical protein